MAANNGNNHNGQFHFKEILSQTSNGATVGATGGGAVGSLGGGVGAGPGAITGGVIGGGITGGAELLDQAVHHRYRAVRILGWVGHVVAPGPGLYRLATY